jgi:predicted SprT family Zn-dependent metalloprotease
MGVKGFKDGDREFENELVRIGSHKTRTELKNVKSNRPKLIRYGIECGKCGESAGHYKTEKGAKNCVEGGRYISRCCKHQLVYSGKVEI